MIFTSHTELSVTLQSTERGEYESPQFNWRVDMKLKGDKRKRRRRRKVINWSNTFHTVHKKERIWRVIESFTWTVDSTRNVYSVQKGESAVLSSTQSNCHPRVGQVWPEDNNFIWLARDKASYQVISSRARKQGENSSSICDVITWDAFLV